MRKLLILNGPSGCGKGALIQSLGLNDHALKMGDLLKAVAAPILMPDGRTMPDANAGHKAMQLQIDLAQSRMANGDFLIISGSYGEKDLKDLATVAAFNRYQVGVVDFSKQSLQKLFSINESAAKKHQISNNFLRKEWDAHQKRAFVISEAVVFNVQESHHEAVDFVSDFLASPIKDLSAFENLVFVGDVQGCWTVLKDNLFAQGADPKTAYIFLGDLLDRGIENAEVLSNMMAISKERENFFFVWGNHEDHLWLWANGKEAVSEEFRKNTQPSLEISGISKKETSDFLLRFNDALWIEWNGVKIQCCHGGIPTIPDRPSLISSRQYVRGGGGYRSPIDQIFTQSAPRDWYQVHGHRNPNFVDMDTHSRSFTLEERVEFGGYLRIVQLNKEGWSFHRMPNSIFSSSSVFEGGRKKTITAPWSKTPSSDFAISLGDKSWSYHAGEVHLQDVTHPAFLFPEQKGDIFFSAPCFKSLEAVTPQGKNMPFEKDFWKSSISQTKADAISRWLSCNNAALECVFRAGQIHLRAIRSRQKHGGVFEFLDSGLLNDFAKEFGLNIEKPVFKIKSHGEMKGAIKQLRSKFRWSFEGAPVNGVILMDSSGAIRQLKSTELLFWENLLPELNKISHDIIHASSSHGNNVVHPHPMGNAILSWWRSMPPVIHQGLIEEGHKALPDLMDVFEKVEPGFDRWSKKPWDRSLTSISSDVGGSPRQKINT